MKESSMTTISLRIPESLLNEVSHLAKARRLPRSEYIRRALDHMNRETESAIRQRRIAEASRRVRESSMNVNAEFDVIEYDRS